MKYRYWLFIAIFLFAVGMTCGLVLPGSTASFLAEDLAALRELGSILGPFQLTTAMFIFLKNVSALLFSFLLSPILCLVPLLALTVNGWLLSFVSLVVVQEESLGFLLSGLLPHGIIELPAVIIGEAAALSFGVLAITALVSKKRRNQFTPGLKQNLKYLVLACLLLLPAAIIETYLTPLLIR